MSRTENTLFPKHIHLHMTYFKVMSPHPNTRAYGSQILARTVWLISRVCWPKVCVMADDAATHTHTKIDVNCCPRTLLDGRSSPAAVTIARYDTTSKISLAPNKHHLHPADVWYGVCTNRNEIPFRLVCGVCSKIRLAHKRELTFGIEFERHSDDMMRCGSCDEDF